MKILIEIDPTGARQSVELTWQMPGSDDRSHLYLMPKELVPDQYPHSVNDLSRVAVFYGDHFTLFSDPVASCNQQDCAGVAQSQTIYCNTWNLLAIIKTLHDRRVAKTVLDTSKQRRRTEEPPLTVGQLANHPNLHDKDRFGRTLKHFCRILANGTERTFNDLLRDLSRYVRTAKLYAQGDEFYFNGRYPGGCGYNGGIIPHEYANSYGIHT